MDAEVKKFFQDIFTGLNGYFPKTLVYPWILEIIITACGQGYISPDELVTVYNHLKEWKNDSN